MDYDHLNKNKSLNNISVTTVLDNLLYEKK